MSKRNQPKSKRHAPTKKGKTRSAYWTTPGYVGVDTGSRPDRVRVTVQQGVHEVDATRIQALITEACRTLALDATRPFCDRARALGYDWAGRL